MLDVLDQGVRKLKGLYFQYLLMFVVINNCKIILIFIYDNCMRCRDNFKCFIWISKGCNWIN